MAAMSCFENNEICVITVGSRVDHTHVGTVVPSLLPFHVSQDGASLRLTEYLRHCHERE